MASHRRVPDGRVAVRSRADIGPVSSSAAGHDDRVPAVGLEDPEHVGGGEHGLLLRYRLKPWYSSAMSTATGRRVRRASSNAIEMRGASAELSTR